MQQNIFDFVMYETNGIKYHSYVTYVFFILIKYKHNWIYKLGGPFKSKNFKDQWNKNDLIFLEIYLFFVKYNNAASKWKLISFTCPSWLHSTSLNRNDSLTSSKVWGHIAMTLRLLVFKCSIFSTLFA